jgi:hypothetical protein
MYALVRIVHGKAPEKMNWATICKLYHEAVWYENYKVKRLAETLAAMLTGAQPSEE